MYNCISSNLLRGGAVTSTSTVDLGNSIVDRRPPNHSTVPYMELNNFLDDVIPTGREFIYYFTLAIGFNPQTVEPKYWHDKFREIHDASGCSMINFAYNLEYHSDGVTLHAHGALWNNAPLAFQKFKRQLRKSFKISSTNRVAIKYYQNNNINHTSMDKLKYHLTSTSYNGEQKDNVENFFTYYRGSDAGAE